MTERYLIINADDFGQSPAINSGIIDCFENGIVTSTSLMVRYPSAAAAAGYAKLNPSLSVGLHADLGEWTLRNGEWEPLYLVTDISDPQQVKTELYHQLDRFVQLTGKEPSHLDSHQHVHKRESLFPVFNTLAAELNIPLRHFRKKISYCGSFYGQLENGDTYPEAISTEGLKNTLRNLGPGITELACHPASGTDLATLYSRERETERATLCDPSIKNFLQSEHISLISFNYFQTGEGNMTDQT